MKVELSEATLSQRNLQVQIKTLNSQISTEEAFKKNLESQKLTLQKNVEKLQTQLADSQKSDEKKSNELFTIQTEKNQKEIDLTKAKQEIATLTKKQSNIMLVVCS